MNCRTIFNGSDGEATKLLYAVLAKLGPSGELALNLFRACKASGRAKVYRGGNNRGRFRDQAYEKKQWSIGWCCKVLKEHAGGLGITWGWKADPKTIHYPWVLYVDLPTGQVSFHTGARGDGPDYPGEWDRMTVSSERIIAYADQVLHSSDVPVEAKS